MPAGRGYTRRYHTTFTTVRSEGAMLPVDLLQRIVQVDPNLDGLRPEDYHLSGEKLNEAINRSWNRLLSAWAAFQSAREKLPGGDAGTTITRERWLLPLFNELGYGRLIAAKPIDVGEKSYAVSHSWQHTPIHLVSFKVDLDHASRGMAGASRISPHSLVQELLNRSEEHLWSFVSSGLKLRVLRDNVSLTRQAYVEFDLEAMMNGEVYADFVLLWLLCHESRVEAERPENCWLEQWTRTAHEQGTRALDQLRNGVEKAIAALGGGFLAHPVNTALREKLRGGSLDSQDYYRQVLRLVYRLLVLFVAEDRNILCHPEASEAARDRYMRYYSTARLRCLAEQRVGTRHVDLFCSLRLIMEKLGDDQGCPQLGLPAFDSYLFSRGAIADLAECEIANVDLLDAIRSLAFTNDGRVRRTVDYKNLGAEELGSVYESLLELHPVLHIEAARFELKTAGGHERKTTGSYYTPTSLITCLLDSALDPVLDEACSKPDPEKALLNLKVCDPACGSGHFLIAAAHRIARRLAAIRTGEEEPAPEARRKALRDVVGRCIYGVDINPMAVELCKVSLWMEAIEPGKPFSFLEQHIQCGNSLLGATPALLSDGIPDSAFESIEGDDKKLCSEYKRKNKREREGNQTLFDPEGKPWEHLGNLATAMMRLDEMSDDTVEEMRSKQAHYEQLVRSSDYRNGRLLADAWCAAFVWKKNNQFACPITQEIFRNIEKNPYNISTWMYDEIQRLSAQYHFFHWHLAFPDVFRVPRANEQPENEQAGWSGGFNVVLGNPPWENTPLKEQEWFAAYRPDIAQAEGVKRKRMIEALAASDSNLYHSFLDALRYADGLSHFVRNSQRYPLCGRGRINTYALFAETNCLISSYTGRIGCIVPSGIATDDTTKSFFQDLMQTSSLVSLYDFENRKNIFPGVGHGRSKFCLLTLTGRLRPAIQGADFVFFAYGTEDLSDEHRHFTLSKEDISLLNPNTGTCPTFRSKHDLELTKSIYQHVPLLIKEVPIEENPWDFSIYMMFHMTNDSHIFRSRERLETDGWTLKGNIFHRNGDVCLPLFEGKMVWHFDHRFGTYDAPTQVIAGNGKLPELTEQEHFDPSLLSVPHYWVRQQDFPTRIADKRKAFLVFRDITRSADFRTAIFSIIPIAPCGNNLPIALLNPKYTRELTYFAAATSSFVFDYTARQKVGGTHMNFFILKQLPVLPPSIYQESCEWDNSVTLGDWIWPRSLELTYTAWDLEAFAKDCGYKEPPFRWEEARRFLLRCELDAAFFHLYGIRHEDVEYIMETFPIARRKDEQKYGEYQTKRMILEIYDEMQRAMETREPYKTRLEPLPADPLVAHKPKEKANIQM